MIGATHNTRELSFKAAETKDLLPFCRKILQKYSPACVLLEIILAFEAFLNCLRNASFVLTDEEYRVAFDSMHTVFTIVDIHRASLQA